MSHQLPRPLNSRAVATSATTGSSSELLEREVDELEEDFVAESGAGEAAVDDVVGDDPLSPTRQRRVVHAAQQLPTRSL